MNNRRLVLLLVLVMISFQIGSAQSAQEASKTVSAEYTFIVFGDNRPTRADLGQPEIFKRMLAMMNDRKPAFAVNTGDCVYGSPDLDVLKVQYDDYRNAISALNASVHLAIGNHEIQARKANQEFFEGELGRLFHSFDHLDSHFIVLNTEIVGETHRVSGDQLEWLNEDLRQSRAAKHRFVFLHRPLFPVNGHTGNSLDKFPKDRDALHALFVRNRVTAVFSGHEHLFHHHLRNGVQYFITGGGGAYLFPTVEGKGDFHHFIAVSVSGDEVEMKVVKPAHSGQPERALTLEEAKRL